MNDTELWTAIDRQRLRVADLLDDLDAPEWERPSLCEAWTIRDVAAHLTLQQLTLPKMFLVVLRNPGGLNGIIRRAAKRRARQPVEDYAGQIRVMVGSRVHNIGITPRETLTDILVHGLDIAIPLGRDLEIPAAAAAWSAQRVWSYGGRGLARVFADTPVRDLRLVATDTDFTVGTGPEIRGPVAALLLLLTGRTAWLDRLEGPGVGQLRSGKDAVDPGNGGLTGD